MEPDLQRIMARMQCCCAGDAAARIEQLLLGSITSPQEASRLCAVQWANRLFPFQHVPARYICALAAGDIKLEIREEGQSGLKPPKPQPGNSTAIFDRGYSTMKCMSTVLGECKVRSVCLD